MSVVLVVLVVVVVDEVVVDEVVVDEVVVDEVVVVVTTTHWLFTQVLPGSHEPH
jgi:hypothetical protein